MHHTYIYINNAISNLKLLMLGELSHQRFIESWNILVIRRDSIQ